jgi:hypothetical protein
VNKRRRYKAKARREQRKAYARLSPFNRWLLSPDGMARLEVLMRESSVDVESFVRAALAQA